MAVITIPKKFTRGDELIIIPRKDWERILNMARKKISQFEIEIGLKKALKEVEKENVIGPFSNAKSLLQDLEK